MSKYRTFTFALSILLLMQNAPAVLAEARSPLLYRFEPGDWLVYELRSQNTSLATGEVIQRRFVQVEIWCFAADKDGALLLLDSLRIIDDRTEPMRGVVLRVDARGRAQMIPAAQQQALEMLSAFDVLPVQAGALEDRNGWSTPPDILGRRQHCRESESEPQERNLVGVDFELDFPPGDGAALGHSCAGKWWFDAAAGHVTRYESTETDSLAECRIESAAILRSRTRKPTGWAERRAAEAEQYLLDLQRESGLRARIADNPDTLEQAVRSLDGLWAGRAADPARPDSPFQTLARANRQRCADDAQFMRRVADYTHRWQGRNAVPWTLPDQRGRLTSSDVARSTACVELLWRTDRPLSIAMLAQLQAARDASSLDVPIICLNLDRDSTAGARALAQLPSGLTHILAGPIEAVEQPVDVPILRVLDRDGKIVRVWIGWQPSCAEAFAEARRHAQ